MSEPDVKSQRSRILWFRATAGFVGAKKRSHTDFTVWNHRDIMKARIHGDGMGGFWPLERDFGAGKKYLG